MSIPIRSRLARLTLPIVLTAASLTCGGDDLTLPDEGTPAAIQPIDGDNQTGPVASPLPDSVIVRVTDSEDRPVVGARIAFVPTMGGGDAVPDTSETDADGRAGSRWILGETAGAQRIEARVVGGGVDGPLVRAFNATALAGAADTILLVSGDGQTGQVGSALTDSLVVRVTDAFGNIVTGASVVWATTDGGSVSPAGTTTTNGEAATRRTLGPVAGPQGATATAAGLKGSPVTFAHTATAGLPAGLLKVSGDNQSGAAGAALADSIVVRVVDGDGNGVPGRAVAFAIATGGGSVSPTSVTSDAGGRAAARWTLGPVAGPNSVIASAAGFSVTFQATGGASAATTIAANSTTTQTDTAGAPVAAPPSVKVSDANGNGVQGIAVTFAVTVGGGSIVPSTPVTTNAGGIATLTSWTLGNTAGPNTVTATRAGLTGSPVSFNATGVAGEEDALAMVTQPSAAAQSGVAFATQPAVRLVDLHGNPVSKNGVTVTAALATGSGSLGGTLTANTTSGVATFSNLSITGPSGNYTIRFTSTGLTQVISGTVTLGAGAAAKLAIINQPSDTAQNAIGFPTQPTVQVQDAAGNPVAGVRSITASIAAGGGTIGGTSTINTNAAGLASFTDLRITGTVGARTLRFQSATLTDAVSAAVVIIAGAPTQMTIQAGNGQTATAGTAVAIDPSVLLRDVSNNPVPGVDVTFAVTGGGGSVAPTTAVQTNASGIAAATSWTLGVVAGANTLSATAAPGGISGNPVGFTATGTAGSAGKLAITTQPPAGAQSGASLSPNPVIQLQDVNGNPVTTDGIAITANIASGPGASSLGGSPVETTVDGVATFDNLRITGLVGSYTLSFTGTNLTGVTSTSISLSAGAASRVVIVTQPPTTAQSGVTFTEDPQVQVQDAGGNPVGCGLCNVTVSIVSGGGTLGGTSTRPTNAGGLATFTDLSISGTVGSRTLLFAAGGLTTDTSDPIAVVPGLPAKLTFGQQPTDATAGQAIAPSPTVIVRDAADNIVTTATNAIAMAILNNPGGANLGGDLSVNAIGGTATFTDLTLDATGANYTLQATSGALTGATSIAFDVTAGSAARLAMFTQPSATAQSGIGLGTQPVIQLQDALGNPVALAGETVMAALASGPGSLSGDFTKDTDANGRATFTDLVITGTTGSYALNFSSGALTDTNSSAITLSAGAPTQLAFTVHPSDVAAGEAITPAVKVAVRDGAGNLVTTATTQITLALSSNPAGGTLGGTTIVNAVAGVATFSTLTVDEVGSGYALGASGGGLSPATSQPFDVTPGAPASLAFLTPPSDAVVGSAIAPAVQIEILDGEGNRVTTATNAVTVDFGNNPTGATLGGDKTNNAVAGVATFSDLEVNEAGTGYTLTADATGLTGDESSAFNVAATPTTTTITSDTPDPSSVGEAVTVLYSVTSGGGSPTGSVTVTALGGSESCVGTVAAGSCSITLDADGSRTLTATYAGDANFDGSADTEPHTVTLAATTTAITVDSPDPSVVGEGFTVSFNVTTAFGTPTGDVTVSDGVESCTAAVAAGNCTLTLTTVGSRNLTASYEGDATHAASVSAGTAHTVNQGETNTTLEDHVPDPSNSGDPVTVSWTVTVNGPGAGTPTGDVTVTTSGGSESCTAPVGDGSCQIPLAASGSHTLTVTYVGDSQFLGSASSGTAHTVN